MAGISMAAGREQGGREADYAHCATAVRAADPDRFFASLFAPAAARPHLLALYAFSGEIARIRGLVSEPRLGEIRMQWWRDALEGETRGDVQANPIAAALFDTIARFRLPRSAFVDLIEARRFDLYDDLLPTVPDLEGYAGETASVLIRLASLVLAGGQDPGGADAAGHAGVAYAVVGLLRAFPWHSRRGQIYVPREILDRHGVTRDDIVLGRGGPGLAASLSDMRELARAHLARVAGLADGLAPAIRPAFLPLALLPAYLKQMERADYDPFRSQVDRPQWRKQLTLWRAARRGRIP
jgi:phytoene synthase